jgi:hypothetical protein
MNRVLLFLLLISPQLVCIGQTLTPAQRHDESTENVTAVLFGSKGLEVRNRLKSFEDGVGVDLNFKVDEQSLNQIGGLSGFLFKLFQTVTSPINTNVRTLTGEFSALENQVLSDILTYKTYATSDLTKCKFPSNELDSLDQSYNKRFERKKLDTTKVEKEPIVITDVCNSLIKSYQDMGYIHQDCKLDNADASSYNLEVSNTAAQRKAHWKGYIDQIKLELRSRDILVSSLSNTIGGNQPGVLVPLIDKTLYDSRFIINLNNSVNECTEKDMNACSVQLFAKTGIRYYFITSAVDFFIPPDSFGVFVNEVAKDVIDQNPGQNFIVAVYLKMVDEPLNKKSNTLLVKQNGNWLTKAEIDFAKFNNGGSYQDATFYRYKGLLKNIPKPLIICYQVAKVNGLLTTTFIRKSNAAKGKEQIYFHVFKIDKGLNELKIIDEKLANAIRAKKNEVPGQDHIIALLKEERYSTYFKALRANKLEEASAHVKETYLEKPEVAHAAAIKYLSETFHGKYDSPIANQILENTGLPDHYLEGSCEAGKSDVVGDYLGVASLLLSPLDLDFIPDALQVLYYLDQGEEGDAAQAVMSLFSVGNISAIKKILNTSKDITLAINRGSKITRESETFYQIEAEQEMLLHSYKISADNAGTLPKLISDNPKITLELLPNKAEEAAIIVNADLLPDAKRKEFIEKCYSDEVFRKKCLKDPEEVLRWGGKLGTNDVDKWVKFATKQNEKRKVMFGMWDGGGANSYISKAGSEYTYFDFGEKWNDLYNLVNKSDDEIWKINEEFINRQLSSSKECWFSHDPFTAKNYQFYAREVNYLINLGVKDFQKVGELWKAVW